MSAVLDRCTALLGEPNIRAFLHVIREGETNQTDDAYRMIYGGGLIDGPEHPWYGRTTTEVGHSTAYGAFQFLGTSFEEAATALGLRNDTSPVNQDLCAVWTIDVKRRATAAILDGDLTLACSKLATEWVSLPGLGLRRVQQVFTEYGGKAPAQDHAGELFPGSGIPTPPEAPKPPQTPDLPPYRPPESPMLPAFLLQLLPMITGAFTQGGQAQLQPITSKPADQIAPFLINLFSQVAGATGVLPQGQQIATNEQAVAAAAEFNKLKTTNAALIADIEKRALSYLADIAPLFDRLAAADKAENEARIAGTDAAAKRAITERWDMTPWLVWIAGGTATVLVLALLGAIIWQATTGERNIDVALIGLAGPLLAIAMSVWREIFSYRFDGSPSSTASNAIAQQIAVASKRVV